MGLSVPGRTAFSYVRGVGFITFNYYTTNATNHPVVETHQSSSYLPLHIVSVRDTPHLELMNEQAMHPSASMIH